MSLLIIAGSKSDLGITDRGLALLQDFALSHSLRIASAHRSADFLASIVTEFEKNAGQLVICIAGKSAHLAGVVAAQTALPVIAVPVYSVETAGFDSLLSTAQMPGGVPVATMGFGNHGFINACLLAVRILALNDDNLRDSMQRYRAELAAETRTADKKHRLDFNAD